MVYSRRNSGISYLLDGQSSMEIAILILLSVSLTAALPLKQTHRSESDALSKGAEVQAFGVKRSEDIQQQHVPGLKIIPFISEGKYLDMDALKHRMPAKSRPRRGCQLGTCQVHNLANTLYQISKTSGKEESQNARDPRGFGR